MAEAGHRNIFQRIFRINPSKPDLRVSQYTEQPELPVEEPDIDPEIYAEGVDLVKNLRPGKVHLHGTIGSVTGRYVRSGLHVTDAIFSDPTASVRLVWWNQPFRAGAIKHGQIYEVTGNYALRRGRFGITNPEINLLSEGCTLNQIAVEPVIHEESAHPQIQQIPHHTIWTDPIEGEGVNPDSPWGKLRTKVFNRDNYTCQSCGSNLNLMADHKIELSLGGKNTLSNLQTLCRTCHEAKHGRKFMGRAFTSDDNYGSHHKVSKKTQLLLNAIKNQSDIQIFYSDRFKVRSYRVIRPLKLRNLGRGEYVQAFCRLDNDFRVFRLGRMRILEDKKGLNRYIDDPALKQAYPEEVIERFNRLFS